MYNKVLKTLRVVFMAVCVAGCGFVMVHFGRVVVDAIRNFPDVISGNYQVPLVSVASFWRVAIFLSCMTVALTLLLSKEK